MRLTIGAGAMALALASAHLRAQVPHMTGSFNVDVALGWIGGDVCLVGLPADGDTVRFVLNSGMNIKRITDLAGRALPHSSTAEQHGVGSLYSVRHGASAGPGEPGVCVQYVGAYPVFRVADGDYRDSDGSSVVAFNGQTFRARGEARWYPAPHIAGSGTHDRLTYRITLRCAACRRLYMNGGGVRAGPEAEFASRTPLELVVLAGDFPVVHAGDVLLLGEDVPGDIASALAARLRELQGFYEEFLGLPYGPTPDLVRIIPVRRDRIGQLWGFFSNRMLGMAGLPFGMLAGALTNADDPGHALLMGFVSHELAHRYTGDAFGGRYWPLFDEPLANYLSLHAVRAFVGENAFTQGIAALRQRAFDGGDLPAPDAASPAELAQDRYRYGYAPLLFFALEAEVGLPAMKRFVHALLTAPPAERALADYAFLRGTAIRSGITEAEWQRWEKRCVRPPLRENACLRGLP